jgi:hypothetical protein
MSRPDKAPFDLKRFQATRTPVRRWKRGKEAKEPTGSDVAAGGRQGGHVEEGIECRRSAS